MCPLPKPNQQTQPRQYLPTLSTFHIGSRAWHVVMAVGFFFFFDNDGGWLARTEEVGQRVASVVDPRGCPVPARVGSGMGWVSHPRAGTGAGAGRSFRRRRDNKTYVIFLRCHADVSRRINRIEVVFTGAVMCRDHHPTTRLILYGEQFLFNTRSSEEGRMWLLRKVK